MITQLGAALLILAPSAQNSVWQSISLPLAFFLIFYFILIRPQQRQRREADAMMKGLKKGDEVVTFGGIVARVVHIKLSTEGGSPSADDRVTIESGTSRIVVERGRIAKVLTPKITTPPAKQVTPTPNA